MLLLWTDDIKMIWVKKDCMTRWNQQDVHTTLNDLYINSVRSTNKISIFPTFNANHNSLKNVIKRPTLKLF